MCLGYDRLWSCVFPILSNCHSLLGSRTSSGLVWLIARSVGGPPRADMTDLNKSLKRWTFVTPPSTIVHLPAFDDFSWPEREAAPGPCAAANRCCRKVSARSSCPQSLDCSTKTRSDWNWLKHGEFLSCNNVLVISFQFEDQVNQRSHFESMSFCHILPLRKHPQVSVQNGFQSWICTRISSSPTARLSFRTASQSSKPYKLDLHMAYSSHVSIFGTYWKLFVEESLCQIEWYKDNQQHNQQPEFWHAPLAWLVDSTTWKGRRGLVQSLYLEHLRFLHAWTCLDNRKGCSNLLESILWTPFQYSNILKCGTTPVRLWYCHFILQLYKPRSPGYFNS